MIVAVDGLRATASLLERLATSRGTGETISVHAFRRDELLTAAVVLAPAPLDTCWLELDAERRRTRRATRRLAWLGADPPPG